MFSTHSLGLKIHLHGGHHRTRCRSDARTPEGLGYCANADRPSHLETLPALGVVDHFDQFSEAANSTRLIVVFGRHRLVATRRLVSREMCI